MHTDSWWHGVLCSRSLRALLAARAGPRALAVSGAHQHFLAVVAGGRPGPGAAGLPAPGGQAAALRGPGAYSVPAHVRHLPLSL